MKDNYIVQAWLILMLAVCFGAALSGIELALADKIEQNKIDETYSQIPNIVHSPWWGQEKWAADQVKTQEWVTDAGHLAYKAFDERGDPVGWVIKATGQGSISLRRSDSVRTPSMDRFINARIAEVIYYSPLKVSTG